MKEFSGYKKGINFGGWFSQCDNSEKRYDNFIKKDDFKRVAKWGLDHIRIPVDYNLVQNLDGSFKESGFIRIQHCIDWCKENNLNMILDLHKTIGFSFDDNEKESGFFKNNKYQEYFYSLWLEFTKRFSFNENIAFELLNEINDYEYKDKWNKIARECVKRIRTINSNIKILIGGYFYNSVSAIKDLDLPYDENIVYNFHCYNPLIFTHQGAYWIDKMDANFRMHFDENTNKYEEYTNKYIGEKHVDVFKANSNIDESFFEELFKEAIEICENRNVSLYCGEYGVIDKADSLDTVKWFKCINNIFNKYNIGRALWSYKEMDFGLVDAHYDDIREKLIKLL